MHGNTSNKHHRTTNKRIRMSEWMKWTDVWRTWMTDDEFGDTRGHARHESSHVTESCRLLCRVCVSIVGRNLLLLLLWHLLCGFGCCCDSFLLVLDVAATGKNIRSRRNWKWRERQKVLIVGPVCCSVMVNLQANSWYMCSFTIHQLTSVAHLFGFVRCFSFQQTKVSLSRNRWNKEENQVPAKKFEKNNQQPRTLSCDCTIRPPLYISQQWPVLNGCRSRVSEASIPTKSKP